MKNTDVSSIWVLTIFGLLSVQAQNVTQSIGPCMGSQAPDGSPAIGCVHDGCCQHDYQVGSLCHGDNVVCCYSASLCGAPLPECLGTVSNGSPAIGCVTSGCCEFDFQIADLCAGNDVCCYSKDTCGTNPGPGCFDVSATWISRYNHHQSSAAVDAAFSTLRGVGITRVYFNVWADGNIYFNSPTAINQGAIYRGENLQWAVDAGKKYGIQVFAWFEYGNMAGFGPILNSFGRRADQNGWMLFNMVGGQKNYISNEAGQFTYLNPNLVAVQNFLADMVADAVRYYDVDGVQLDDHYVWPNGFNLIDSIPKAQRYSTMQSFMTTIRNAVRAANPGAILSYSPSVLHFARDNHNVDWAAWPLLGVTDEMVPQYYYTTGSSFQTALDRDLALVQGSLDKFYSGIRLSGSANPPVTPTSEVNQMLSTTTARGLKGVSYWFADDLVGRTFTPPTC